MTSATFPEAELSREADRRLSVAIAISLVLHALTLAALRGLPATMHVYAEGAAGNLPSLQAVLAGPPTEPTPEEPTTPPESAINPNLVIPPKAAPVETLFGRTRPATAPSSGGPVRSTADGPEVSVAVGTIADPAKLGSDYVAQLAQRFPQPVQQVPLLLGAPVVVYPRAALEAGIEGRFAAVISVDALGKVTEAKLVVEDPIFGPVMLDALKSAEFAPARNGTETVPYWAIVEFIFTIGRPAAQPAAAPAQRRGSTALRQPRVGR
ncbi:MAG TPA: energy transducer TonB [Casimicrobiaceae bacterium]|nr:energy transducer TonB [Casimicrobiaceae bacterium]